MRKPRSSFFISVLAMASVLFIASACEPPKPKTEAPTGEQMAGLSDRASQVAAERELSPDDVVAALMTYTPSGRHDEYLMFSSGGHGGQLIVIGIPSMRIIKNIGVFTPEPWQGWGYGAKDSMDVLTEGSGGREGLSWGDTHHPALSETGGDYDGQFVFINDKAQSRVAVIDLRDFETKQIVKNPLSSPITAAPS